MGSSVSFGFREIEIRSIPSKTLVDKKQSNSVSSNLSEFLTTKGLYKNGIYPRKEAGSSLGQRITRKVYLTQAKIFFVHEFFSLKQTTGVQKQLGISKFASYRTLYTGICAHVIKM